MLLVLPQKKLVGHPSDVIANDDRAAFHSRELLVSHRHGARFPQIVCKEFFETLHRAIAIFGNGWKTVNV